MPFGASFGAPDVRAERQTLQKTEEDIKDTGTIEDYRNLLVLYKNLVDNIINSIDASRLRT